MSDLMEETAATVTEETHDDATQDNEQAAEGRSPGRAPDDIPGAVEALIFSGAQPIPSPKISEALGKIGVAAVKKAVAELNEKYEAGGHAFRIRQVGGGYQYYVLPENAEFVKKLYSRERKLRLTKASLETLAIIAYKQPVSKNQVEYIRGVASDGVISNLLEKNLIRIAGRGEGVGRPLLYAPTDEFLKFFGLNSFDDLPKIQEIEEMISEMEAERLERMPVSEAADAEDSQGDLDFTADTGEAPDEDSGEETEEDSTEPRLD